METPDTDKEVMAEQAAEIEKLKEAARKKEAQDWAKQEGSGGKGGGGGGGGRVVAMVGAGNSVEERVVVAMVAASRVPVGERQAGTLSAGTAGAITFVISARTGIVVGRVVEDGGVVAMGMERVVAATAREEEGTGMGKGVGKRSGVGKEDGVVVVAMAVVGEVAVVVAVAEVAATKSTMLAKVALPTPWPTHRTPPTGRAHTMCGRG